MEKMKGPLWDVIPPLLQAGNPIINIGPIAEQLLTCVEIFHNEKHLLIDIKPDNFMLAYTDHNRKIQARREGNAVADELAAKVRVLDLGLVCPYRTSTGAHRPDDGIGEIVGTPLYSSLNVHQGHTPSRRDDVEALGLVVAELIIRIVATANGELGIYEAGDVPSYLPWSQQQSDQDIGKVKEKEIMDSNSQFYQRMGNKATAQTMKRFFEATQSIKYKEEPIYSEYRDMLSSLTVSVETPKKKAAIRKSSTTSARPKTTRSRKCKRDSTKAEGKAVSPRKMRKKQQSGEMERVDLDHAVMEVDSDNDVFVDAIETAEEMEWEPLKENRATSSCSIGVLVLCEEGPHAGEQFALKHGEYEAVIIGKNPSCKTKPSEALWQLADDDCVDDVHVRLELRTTRQICSVKVSDLNSSSGSWVRNEKVKKGRDAQAFVNDSVVIGHSKFCLLDLTLSKPPRVDVKLKKAAEKATTKTAPFSEKKRNVNNDASSIRPDLTLVVVSDSRHNGESFPLFKGGDEVLNIGSSCSVAGQGVSVVLDLDNKIEKRHARVRLQSGKIPKVCITDLSESSGTYLNGRKIIKGKEIAGFISDRIQVGATVLEIRRG